MKQYTIRQTFQCSNKWDEMTPQDPGSGPGARHCASCNKIVVDFTQMSDKDIITYLLKNTHTCGLFKKSQLNRPMIIHSYKKRSNWPAIAAMLIAGMFSMTPAGLQAGTYSKPSIEYHLADDKNTEPEKNNQEFIIQLVNAQNNNIITWGNIYIEGLGTFMAEPNGSIIIKNADEFWSKNESCMVTVSANGYISKTFKFYVKDLQKSNGASIYMEVQTEEISPPGTIVIDPQQPTIK